MSLAYAPDCLTRSLRAIPLPSWCPRKGHGPTWTSPCSPGPIVTGSSSEQRCGGRPVENRRGVPSRNEASPASQGR
eukprot:11156435-Lingulodinium_polyedra.AAC.1